MSRRISAISAMLVLVCACATWTRAAPQELRIVVHNPNPDALMVRACGPLGCSDFRRLEADSRDTFRLDGGGGTRAVVEGKLGDRFVARHPVDFTPGKTYHVELSANL